MEITRTKKHFFVSFLVFTLLVVLALTWINRDSSSSAADARKFNAGNIMSDFVMTNKSSMTEAQIQTFLLSKNSCNDRNISKAAAYPHLQYNIRDGKFVCLAEESFNGESAARIIWQAAQDYNINPRVLIVLLEKEQGLITDTWPNNIQYRAATGYGCPDTADCDGKYYGFKNQVRNAANFFRAYQTGNTGWYKLVWPGNKYTGAWQPFDYAVQLHPNAACGSINTRIENRATASLYSYTPYRPNQAALNAQYGHGDGCSSYGNRNFWLYFNDWFGSTTEPTAEACDSKVSSVTCVWSVRKDDGSQFLTSSKTELADTMYTYGWVNEGVAFYAADKQKPGATPVYRLRHNNQHYFTIDQAEKNRLGSTTGWVDEGIRFYALPATTSNSSHSVYKLRNPSNSHNYWTKSNTKKRELVSSGYVEEAPAFDTFSRLVTLPQAKPGRANVYRLNSGYGYFYTTDLSELEDVLSIGWRYENVLTDASVSNVGTPVYRLYGNGRHFYTTDATERDSAISRYGFVYEGVKFYLDSTSNQIYRLLNLSTGAHLFTSNVREAMSLSNKGWKFEKMLLKSEQSHAPVYRFVNIKSGSHFYTLNAKEATSISNAGWRYEGIAFHASHSNGLPVYRLYGNGEHFYTTDRAERDNAVSRYGYTNQGIRFYVMDR